MSRLIQITVALIISFWIICASITVASFNSWMPFAALWIFLAILIILLAES